MKVDKYPTKLEGVSGTTEKTAACCNKRSSKLSRSSKGSMAHSPLQSSLSHFLHPDSAGGMEELLKLIPLMSPGDRADKDVGNLKHGNNEGLRENLCHLGLGLLICIPEASLCTL